MPNIPLRILLCLLILLAGCGRRPLDYSGPVAQWPEYGAELSGLRYSPLTQITIDNVSNLREVWTYNSGDFSLGSDTVTRTSLQVTPIVTDGTLYFCTPFNRVIALDPETGVERWSFDPNLRLKLLHGAYPLTCRGVSAWTDSDRGETEACQRRIFTATHDAELIALDARTGEPCQAFGDSGRVQLRVGMGDSPDWEYYVTSPPLVVHDIVIVGGLVADNIRANAPPGVVRAYDARTGAQVWAWDPVPPGDRATVPSEDGAIYRRSTANVWSIMSADAERGLVFVPTGNAPPDYFGGQREELDYFSSSVVALRTRGPAAGTLVWNFQTVHHDLWDYDIGAQPSLFDLETPEGPVPVVAVSTKAGQVFILNRETGEPIFPVEERPVPQSPALGDSLSATQPFATHPSILFDTRLEPDDAFGLTFWDRGKCREKIAALRTDGLFTPPTVQGSLHFPGALGGINWGGAAIDPNRKILIVNQSHLPTAVTLIPRAEFDALPSDERNVSPGGLPGTTQLFGEMQGTPYAVRRELLFSPFGLPCNPPPWGTLSAVDIDSGDLLWQQPFGTTRGQAPWPLWFNLGLPSLGGPIITGSGLIFIAAATDQYLRAVGLETGEELWKYHLPFAGHATPLTYRLRPQGRQFVVIAAGGHATSEPGDAIVAFALETAAQARR